jgi:alpha-ketoglutarate-dependent 2,4-dichlorophenoxyacetate dioxygenase
VHGPTCIFWANLTSFSLKSGGTVAAGTDAYFNLQGNEGWHIDNTYQPRSAKAGILRAAVLPAGGSQTEFCDGRAAFEALDAAAQRRIEGLAAFHSGLYSQVGPGRTVASEARAPNVLADLV